MLLAPARKRNVQCDARRRHRRCRYENRTSARPVGSSRIRLHGVAGARKRGAMSLPGNHVGSRQCAIRPESRVKQTCQGYRSTDANDPERSSAKSQYRGAAGSCRTLWCAYHFGSGQAAPHPIQNNSGLPQGPADLCADRLEVRQTDCAKAVPSWYGRRRHPWEGASCSA